jgi:CIC family chloride channel protein
VYKQNELLGIIDFEEVNTFIFNANHIKFMSIGEIISLPKEIISLEYKPEKIMLLFETSKMSILPVIHKGKFVGFLSKIDVLESYRKRLKEMIIE